MMKLDLHKLFTDVFHPESDEKVLVLTDVPHGTMSDHGEWQDRRRMAHDWRRAFLSLAEKIGFSVLPLVSYPATGEHNRELPLELGDPMPLTEALSEATLAVALTEFSATAPLVQWVISYEDIRIATLPGVARRTEQTALAADYAEVARRCQVLADKLQPAMRAHVVFSTGHEWQVDLRYRPVKMDNGQLPRHKPGVPLINLPSGETFQVPYEGERADEPSLTEGEVPVQQNGQLIVFRIERNRIVQIQGDGTEAERMDDYFGQDPARSNIAEFAFGCNPLAVVWGNVLEDEKAGFHWAYGRSEHLTGGTVSPADFRGPEYVVHQDIVYANGSPISIRLVELEDADGQTHRVIHEGEYTVF